MTKLDVAATDLEALPARSVFAERYRKGKPQVVWTRLVADLETPVSAALKLSDGQPMSCLLESVEGGAVRGRYSIIGIAPDIVWRAFGGRAEINRRPLADPTAFEVDKLPTLQSLRALLAQFDQEKDVSVRRALLLAVGELGPDRLPDSRVMRVSPMVSSSILPPLLHAGGGPAGDREPLSEHPNAAGPTQPELRASPLQGEGDLA